MSLNQSAISTYESIARDLQEFLYNKKTPRVHTEQELFDKLDDIRKQMWESYDDGREELGWKE